MRLFVTSSFIDSREATLKLCSLVRTSGFEDFSFIRDVEKFQVTFDDPKDMMIRALDELRKSDVLLIDMSKKPTGRAFEAGAAFALGKRIVVILKKGTKIENVTIGIADVIIEYDQIDDIVEKLREYNETFDE